MITGLLRRGKNIERRDIDECPAVVDQRSRFSDFEGVTIVGNKHKGVLFIFTDRNTWLCIIRPYCNRKSPLIAQSSVEALKIIRLKPSPTTIKGMCQASRCSQCLEYRCLLCQTLCFMTVRKQ